MELDPQVSPEEEIRSRGGRWSWTLKLAKRKEMVLDSKVSPEEIKRREVELDPQVSQEEGDGAGL